MTDSEDKSPAPATSPTTKDYEASTTMQTFGEKDVPIDKETTPGTRPGLLSLPSTYDGKNMEASAASSFTDDFEKPAVTETDSQKAPSLRLTKTKTAASQRKDGLELKKTRTAAETIASVVDQFPKSFKLASIVVALALSIFLVSLDMTIVATAIPEITNEFDSLPDIGWYGSAFFLTVASFQSTWGKIYRYFPLKTSFLVSIFIFELGSLICAVAKNSVTLIVGRAVAGVGGAGVASGAYTIMAFSAPPSRRAAFTGFMGAAYGIASVIGPLLGGVFTSDVTWRWCFYINLPIGGFSAFIILVFFSPPPAAKPQQATWREKLLQMDFPGTFMIMAAVVCYLLAVQWGGTTKAWNDSEVIGLFVGFGLMVITFVAIEYFSGERALLVGRLLKKRNILMSVFFIFFFAGSFFILLYYLPIYFQSVDGVSPADSGVRNIPLLVAASIFSILSGALISSTGYFQPFLIIGSALTAAGVGLIYTLDIGTIMGKWIGYQVLAGVGLGLAIQTAIIVGQSAVDPVDLSTVTAMILFFQTIGGAFFVQAGQSAFSNQLQKSLPTTAPGVSPALVIGTGASNLVNVFTPQQLPGIRAAYMDGLRVSYAIAIAMAGVSFVFSWLFEWKSIKGKAQAGGAV